MTPLWRDRIESVIDADRFDLDDWHTAQAALPSRSPAFSSRAGGRTINPR